MSTKKTPVKHDLRTDEPVGLLAVSAEHADSRRKELRDNPASAAALQKQLFGDQWARVPRATRRAGVQKWMERHTVDRFLEIDLKAHQLV